MGEDKGHLLLAKGCNEQKVQKIKKYLLSFKENAFII